MSPEPSTFGVYIHIPFCRTRCPYCDFVSTPLAAGAPPPAFVDALCREIRQFEGPRRVTSVFIGGGTPSLLSPDNLEQLFTAVLDTFQLCDPEITLEANPDDVTSALVRAWRSLGVNRISVGAQSFNNAALRYLGRRHRAAKARRALDMVANHFENWSMDLIFGAPPVSAWEETLATAVAIGPPHIAVYGLTYEPGAPFGSRAGEALDDDGMLACYQRAERALAGYDHYEISNFSRPGFQCRHNLVYWHNEPYVGFGPGAYSYIAGARMRNLTSLDDYIRAPGSEKTVEALSVHEQQVETLIQHFRLQSGISDTQFCKRFGVSFNDRFAGPLHALQERGLLRRLGDRLYPTRQGFYLNNEIGLALVDASPETLETT